MAAVPYSAYLDQYSNLSIKVLKFRVPEDIVRKPKLPSSPMASLLTEPTFCLLM
jgi:hypothetical protein